MYEKERRIFAILSVVCWMAYVLCLFVIKQELIADILSPTCAFFAALSVGLVSFSNQKYKLAISLIALGPIFWMLADVLYIFNDLGMIGDDQIVALSIPIYRMTSYAYVVGLLGFTIVQYKKQDVMRLVINAFLFTIATAILSVSLFQLFQKNNVELHDFSRSSYPNIIVAMFIIAFFLIITANHSDNRISAYGLIVLISFFIYGVCDIRYTLLEGSGGNPESLVGDAIFLLSIVLLGFAYATKSVVTLMEDESKGRTKRSGIPGLVLAAIVLALGMILMMLKALSLSGFFMLLISCMAYFLLSKTLQVNELNEQLIAQKEEELTEANEKLANVSVLDVQTGLKNRRAWNRYRDELKDEKRNSRLILYSMDINFFKMINDTYGTAAADKLLAEIGRRLLSIEDMGVSAFRLDGDQFMVLCEDPSHEVDAAKFADYLINVMDRPYEVAEKIIRMTFSIGAAIYPDDIEDVDQLMSCAESVRTASNPNGNMSTCAFFDSRIIPRIQRENLIESKLQNLDYESGLQLFYQPQVISSTGELIGMEALLRWNDEDLGYIPPSEFVPIAENMGVMPALGEWIVRHALMQIGEWNRTYGKNLKVGINVSPKQLQEEYFAETFYRIMKEMDVDPAWIDAEVTESVALNGIILNTNIISSLKKEGLSISVDDFGTGYAAFSNMISFKFDRLKIAKELIDNITIHSNAKVIVGSIIDMAKGMNLATIAEGVEEKEQVDCLVELGCDQIQGYYFGKPIPAEEFEKKWLK